MVVDGEKTQQTVRISRKNKILFPVAKYSEISRGLGQQWIGILYE